MVTAQLGVYIGAPLFLYNEKKNKTCMATQCQVCPRCPFYKQTYRQVLTLRLFDKVSNCANE